MVIPDNPSIGTGDETGGPAGVGFGRIAAEQVINPRIDSAVIAQLLFFILKFQRFCLGTERARTQRALPRGTSKRPRRQARQAAPSG